MSTQLYRNIEFDEDQRSEIQAGLAEGVNVTVYAKPEFLAIQMRQIRFGLQDNLDVSVYALPEYDWFQMEEIRLGMKDGLNYSLYAKPEIDYRKMRQVRLGLKDGIDISMFLQLDAETLKELREAVAARVSIIDYVREGYRVEQLGQIRKALVMDIDIRPYIKPEMNGSAIQEIRLGLEEKLPVEIYAGMDYNWRQMREIRLGLEAGLDVAEYSNSLYDWKQMREIRMGLEAGLDVSRYKSFVYTAQDMERIRNSMLLAEAENVIHGMTQTIETKYATVFISKDEMEACIEVNLDQNVTVSAWDIEAILKSHGVCQGIMKDRIMELVEEKQYRQTIVVAMGKEAQKGEDGWYEFFFNTKPTRKPKVLPDGSVDFRTIEWYEMVEAGQKIAYYHPAQFGRPGYTVTGKFLKSHKGKEQLVLSGRNFDVLPDKRTFVAAIGGKIDMIEENRIEISRACIYEEVNMATGNVNFDGSVYVRGNVSKGSAIYATENVVICGYVEGAIIQCGGDICLRQGVNGAGIGVIEAGGSVMGQFFESTRVIARGDMSAYYCLNCEVWIEGSLSIFGKKGMLAGGSVRAARGITSYTVGNKAKIATVLNVGVDSKILNELWQLEGKIEGVNKELAILTRSYMDFKKKYAPEIRNTMQLYLKIEDAIYTKELQRKELTAQKDAMEETMHEMMGAKIIVGGVLHEGTEVIIDNVRWKSFDVQDVAIRCHNKKILVESN